LLTASEIGTAGEKHATAWLQANGWSCYRNTQLPGATDIQATSGTKSILVQVKTAVFPNQPVGLSADDKNAIVARANKSSKEAWLAQLQINSEGLLVGQISWTRLN
jgi:Holliday junction resolvase